MWTPPTATCPAMACIPPMPTEKSEFPAWWVLSWSRKPGRFPATPLTRPPGRRRWKCARRTRRPSPSTTLPSKPSPSRSMWTAPPIPSRVWPSSSPTALVRLWGRTTASISPIGTGALFSPIWPPAQPSPPRKPRPPAAMCWIPHRSPSSSSRGTRRVSPSSTRPRADWSLSRFPRATNPSASPACPLRSGRWTVRWWIPLPPISRAAPIWTWMPETTTLWRSRRRRVLSWTLPPPTSPSRTAKPQPSPLPTRLSAAFWFIRPTAWPGRASKG